MSPIRSYPKRIHKVDEVKARSDDGIDLVDDLGNLGISIDDGGHVGIGTDDPERQLDVEDGSDFPQVRITHTDDTHYAEIEATSNGTLRMTPSSRTAQIDTGDGNGGNLQFTKSGGIVSGGISWDTGDQDVTVFSEADLKLGAGGSDPDVFIDNGGNVGVGSASPDRRLDVEDGSDAPQVRLTYDGSNSADLFATSNGTLRLSPSSRTVQVDTGDTNGGNLQFTKAGGIVSGGVSWDTGDQDVTVYSEADLMLGAGGTSAKVFIDNGGDVGIGNTDPAEKLDVTGTATVDGLQIASSGTMTNIIDDDTMGTASATTLATSESIKAYVDSSSGSGDVTMASNTTTDNVVVTSNGTGSKAVQQANAAITTGGQSLTVDSASGITIGAGGDEFTITESSDVITLENTVTDKDIILKTSDGGTGVEVLKINAADPAVHIKGGAAQSGTVRLYEDSDAGTNYVDLKVPSMSSSWTWTFPDDDGTANQVLKTDGNGATDWVTTGDLTSVSLTGDSGGALAESTGDAGFTITGGTNATTSGAGTTITIDATDRFTVSARYRIAALGTTTTRYFTRDTDASAEQYYIVYAKAVADPYEVDMDWISGFESGPQFVAPRACKLTQISATSKLKGTGTHCRIHVFKGTVTNASAYNTQVELTEIGTADMGPASGAITDNNIFAVNQAITSGNAGAAGQAVVIALAPVGGTITATSYMGLTMEFEVT